MRLGQVAGLSLPSGEGGTSRTAPRPLLRDLDALPRPAWDLVDVARYRRLWRSRHGQGRGVKVKRSAQGSFGGARLYVPEHQGSNHQHHNDANCDRPA